MLFVSSLQLLQQKCYNGSSIFASFDISLQMILVSNAPKFSTLIHNVLIQKWETYKNGYEKH